MTDYLMQMWESEYQTAMAEAYDEGQRSIFAFHPEWTVSGMCKPDCLPCQRLTELIDERSAGYEEGKSEMEAGGPYFTSVVHECCEVAQAAAPRTLTADDPEPAVTSVGLDRDQSVWQRVGSTEHSRWVNPFMGTREWSDVLARGPVRLIHDGEATPQDECKHTHVQPYAQSDQRPWCVSCGLFVTVIGKEAVTND